MAKAKETLATVKTDTPADEEKKAAAAKAKAVAKAGVKYIAIKDASGEGVKMPLQCKQIMAILNAAPGKTMLRDALLEAMKPVIVTRQPIERILGFYQTRLIGGGFIKIEAPVKEIKVKEAKVKETKPTNQETPVQEAPAKKA